MQTLLLLPAIILGYLVGSFPTGVIAARIFGWPDPREQHSGHTGGRNTYRVAGVRAGLLVAVIDLLKGALAIWLASRIFQSPWAVPLAGAAAVAGHSWPVWLGFKGGMGLSTGAGALGLYFPLAVPGALLVLAFFYLLLVRHMPRAVIFTMLTVPALMLLPDVTPSVYWLAVFCAAVIALRHLSDWNRIYE